MKALSITQPYAFLIVTGRQIWITRQYETAHRGEVAIIASKNMQQTERDICFTKPLVDVLEHPNMLPRQAIVGLADIVACKPALMVFEMTIQPNYETLGNQADLGRWEHGWWAWELRNPRQLMIPIHCRGKNNLSDLRPEIEKEVAAQLADMKTLPAPACDKCGGKGFA